MSNKAKTDKASILIDAENLLDVYEPAFMRMPKIRRIHGSAVRMENAIYDLIEHFYMAYNLSDSPDEIDEKIRHIVAMIGAYGVMQTSFKRLMKVEIDTMKSSSADNKGQMYLFADGVKLAIARCMERLEKGISRWRSSLKSARIISAQWSAHEPEVGQ